MYIKQLRVCLCLALSMNDWHSGNHPMILEHNTAAAAYRIHVEGRLHTHALRHNRNSPLHCVTKTLLALLPPIPHHCLPRSPRNPTVKWIILN